MKQFSNARSWAWVVVFIAAVLFVICISVAPGMTDERQPVKETLVKSYESEVVETHPCVKGYRDEARCQSCHAIPTNDLIEPDPDAAREYPNFNMKVRDGVGYYELNDIRPGEVWGFFDYLQNHGIDIAVIEIMSPGGSLFDAWTIVSYMNAFPGKVVTRARSFAASAGCLIFVGGDRGYRYIEPTAMLMWHELYTFKFLSIETPTSTEDEALVLRKFQNSTNTWLSQRTKITKEQIDEKVKRKEFWLDGKEAVEFGFADAFIGE
jgi:ATP-dependent protease ClpP protease subunit